MQKRRYQGKCNCPSCTSRVYCFWKSGSIWIPSSYIRSTPDAWALLQPIRPLPLLSSATRDRESAEMARAPTMAATAYLPQDMLPRERKMLVELSLSSQCLLYRVDLRLYKSSLCMPDGKVRKKVAFISTVKQLKRLILEFGTGERRRPGDPVVRRATAEDDFMDEEEDDDSGGGDDDEDAPVGGGGNGDFTNFGCDEVDAPVDGGGDGNGDDDDAPVVGGDYDAPDSYMYTPAQMYQILYGGGDDAQVDGRDAPVDGGDDDGGDDAPVEVPAYLKGLRDKLSRRKGGIEIAEHPDRIRLVVRPYTSLHEAAQLYEMLDESKIDSGFNLANPDLPKAKMLVYREVTGRIDAMLQEFEAQVKQSTTNYKHISSLLSTAENAIPRLANVWTNKCDFDGHPVLASNISMVFRDDLREMFGDDPRGRFVDSFLRQEDILDQLLFKAVGTVPSLRPLEKLYSEITASIATASRAAHFTASELRDELRRSTLAGCGMDGTFELVSLDPEDED